MKRGNSDVSRFQYKVTVFLLFWLFLCQSNEHLQDGLLTKLLATLIEPHNTRITKE